MIRLFCVTACARVSASYIASQWFLSVLVSAYMAQKAALINFAIFRDCFDGPANVNLQVESEVCGLVVNGGFEVACRSAKSGS